MSLQNGYNVKQILETETESETERKFDHKKILRKNLIFRFFYSNFLSISFVLSDADDEEDYDECGNVHSNEFGNSKKCLNIYMYRYNLPYN